MKRVLFFFLILPIFALGQTNNLSTKAKLTKTYTKAIADFIKAANKKNKFNFDTLFFGKHVYGQPDDFPDINLPKTIEKVEIIVITTKLAVKKQKEKKLRIYINLMAWVDKENANFLFVVFSNGFAHQYDYSINYKYNIKIREFELKKLEFNGKTL
jgi:hypothetical protein